MTFDRLVSILKQAENYLKHYKGLGSVSIHKYANETQPPLANLLHSTQVPLLKCSSFDLDPSSVVALPAL